MMTMYTKSPTTTPRPAKVNLESVHAFSACLSVLRMGSVSSERGKFECVGRRFTYCSMSKLKRENKLKGLCFLGLGKLSAPSQATTTVNPQVANMIIKSRLRQRLAERHEVHDLKGFEP
jgi:hypothetical protein